MSNQIAVAIEAGYPHYVYGLLRADSGELFYVGKGSYGRVFDHETLPGIRIGSRHKNHIIRKVGVGAYCIFGVFRTHASALELEKEVIGCYGIERHGGSLTNDTLGGDGFRFGICSHRSSESLGRSD